jgi:hypothetical protein
MMTRNKLLPALAFACGMMLSGSVFAETLSGKIVYKGADDSLVVKEGSVEVDLENVSKIKIALQGQADQLALKARIKRFETEERTVVLAAFRNVGNLPEDTSLIIKANVLEGTNGKVMYGDVFTRTCEAGIASELSDQDSALERLLHGVRERRGCDLEYRGGILLSTVQPAGQTESKPKS